MVKKKFRVHNFQFSSFKIFFFSFQKKTKLIIIFSLSKAVSFSITVKGVGSGGSKCFDDRCIDCVYKLEFFFKNLSQSKFL